ncbi:amino acid permease [Chelatococcus asaccharovorans]|uniref:D-serine/D-alanine/glycine:proton symporter (AAT family) n=1 Tax=Chelatococcus asaccharovorans TaxID=28210 RepID=A0A2V3TW49_9HYPH|nr:amino acid permease [Chelatococcus asaccharovorans]MBS7702151.1 amino acid permease [Chelatococcus asaccharovorans]PXW52920.1 D-serine/D-alanine/glycine:proton symporter (AAT family) [Chelatococcus asaccharovorans]
MRAAQNGEPAYTRGLKPRHIKLISLGGVIGVGLFLGSGRAIAKNGPGLLAAYALAGCAIYFIMRALGELIMHRPVSGAFASHANEFVGRWAGYVTGWSYCFVWVTMGMAEITAIALFVRYWYPDVPQWLPALITLGLLYAANRLTVRIFGEFEFWFAIIKIVTILALIAIGIAALVFGFGPLKQQAQLANLWSDGGFFPQGVLGFAITLQLVMFAFQGIEIIGVTSGEAADPRRTLPRAVNSVIWRILFFYIGSLAVIMTLIPWTEFAPDQSPFVEVFARSGIPSATTIVYLVVISSAASSCNSGLFSTGRMLHALAQNGQAPAAFGRLSAKHVPATAITFSASIMLIGVLLNYLVPGRVFIWITSISTIGGIWTWGMIMWTHLRWRQAVADGHVQAVAFRMPGAPYMNWAVLAFLGLVSLFLALDEDTRVALYVLPFWALALWLGYNATRAVPPMSDPIAPANSPS